jgi:hypothetical protein
VSRKTTKYNFAKLQDKLATASAGENKQKIPERKF